jgi:alpha-tubulin suppressor-like RCC1 family protein
MGGNSFGQLGTGSKQAELFPVPVSDLRGIFITKVSCGHHTAAISDKGELYLWGSGIFGEFVSP